MLWGRKDGVQIIPEAVRQTTEDRGFCSLGQWSVRAEHVHEWERIG